MWFFKTFALSLVVVFLSSSIAFSKTSVWKVSKGDSYLYLGGTIHVLEAQDYPLPCEYKLAYEQSERIIFETDFSAITSPQFAQKVALQGIYPQGETIADKLSPKTLQSLKQYLDSRGLPFQNLAQLKPGMLLSVLTAMELQRLKVSAKGVDQFYSTMAISDKKSVGHLETPQQQIELIAGLVESEGLLAQLKAQGITLKQLSGCS